MNNLVIKSPQEQTELFGYDIEEQMLLDLWHKGRLAGGWLFCGPKGVGKATLAYRLARFILSRDKKDFLTQTKDLPTSLSVNEKDPVFQMVAQQTHPGMKVIECGLKEEELKSRQALINAGKRLDPEVENKRKRFNEIRMDDIRNAKNFLHLTSGTQTWRIMIVDAADDMNINAANALLKSLEEPPAKTIIVLISHSIGKLLPTIRSRCRKLILKPMKNDLLENILKQKTPDLSDQERFMLIELAQGSLGRALNLYQSGFIDRFIDMISLLDGFPDFSSTRLYDFTEEKLKDKEMLKTAQELLVQWLTGICIDAERGNQRKELFDGEKKLHESILNCLSPLTLIESIQEIQKTFSDQDLDQKQVFINAFFKLQRNII